MAPISAPLQGILFMLAGSFFMSLNNAILKWLSAGYPAGQILFMRSAFIFVAIGFFIWRAGGWHTARIGNPKATSCAQAASSAPPSCS